MGNSRLNRNKQYNKHIFYNRVIRFIFKNEKNKVNPTHDSYTG